MPFLSPTSRSTRRTCSLRVGLVPVLALAERAGLGGLIAERLTVAGGRGPGYDAGSKVMSLVAGMAAGADSIDDMDLLRHGAMATAFAGVRAPSTLGTHLRSYTFGHVRQLDAASSRFLLALGKVTGVLDALAAPGAATYVDVDDTIKEMHGYAQQGVAYGYNHTKGLNAQIATISTPGSTSSTGSTGTPGSTGAVAPVIAAARLRRGNVTSAHGAAKIVAEAVGTAKAAGAHTIVVRADSAYYGAALAWAARKAGARFSVTVRSNPSIRAAIAAISDDAWTPIRYPPRDLGRGGAPVGLQRPGRRGPLHRLHRPPKSRTPTRPADRAPGQAPEPRQRWGRAG